MKPNKYIGENVFKVDAKDKVTGKAIYPDDIYFEDMLYVKVKRATHPHAILQKIDVSKAEALPGVVKVITKKDFPNLNKFGLIIKDQPVLVGIGEKMRFMGDALAIVIAKNKEIANRAVKLIKVEVKELEVISSPFRAMESDAPKIHEEGNILLTHYLNKGDIEKGFKESDVIIEKEYKTQHIDQLPLQVESGVAVYDENSGVVTIWAATQWIHDSQADIAQSLNLPKEKIRIIQPVIGGAFGRKEDISVHIHLALAAMATKRPVKLTYTREESMTAQSKRHPIYIKAKTGATKDGKLKAWEVEVVGDTGAYASSGPAVVHKGMYHCTGPYDVPNVKGVAYTVYTNNTYGGAMRGFGTTQMAFAYESQMNILAEELGMDPVELRLKNAYRIGSTTPNGQKLIQSVNVIKTIEEAVKLSKEKEGVFYEEKR
ncbi:aldehyde oxidase [Petrotoga sp. 9PW.55.5.1]|uniref:xanthine dehydrogenase family protein molybdopterin-binding subunit n=1 Tax=Petrotoga sp. 9PW.55.5.1 TaxID=1308979 RepID=UPI000DC550DF|nr:molybdopterin cofactor-binding domain-containing protein [Petrotoga sp. 9PW.55.5.1]RAO98533.1 aldehyde oxidase [Petrotoga sp. 9PW.55.5.1]